MNVNWISVEDRLPEEYTRVWVAMLPEDCSHDWLINTDYREGKIWYNYNDSWQYMDISEPLFWAEIENPEPPED